MLHQTQQPAQKLECAPQNETSPQLASEVPVRSTTLSRTEMVVLRDRLASGNASAIADGERQLETMSLTDLISFLTFARKSRIQRIRNVAGGIILIYVIVVGVLWHFGGVVYIGFLGSFPAF